MRHHRRSGAVGLGWPVVFGVTVLGVAIVPSVLILISALATLDQ
jgi:hypothetical protein